MIDEIARIEQTVSPSETTTDLGHISESTLRQEKENLLGVFCDPIKKTLQVLENQARNFKGKLGTVFNRSP